VAVKLGAEGGLAVGPDGAVVRVAPPSVDVVDTTGAGDSFDAGFLAAMLLGWPVAEALALAVACGSLSTRVPGGTDGQATLDEASSLAGLAAR
jgi:sugar/nucleoside kinase (ribokinase family)